MSQHDLTQTLEGFPSCAHCHADCAELLCRACRRAGYTPSYKRQQCISCERDFLIKWEEPGRVTCGREACTQDAINRLCSYLIGVKEGHHAGQVTS